MNQQSSYINIPTKLAGQSLFYLSGTIFTLLAGFPFQVYIAKHLGASGLGIFGLLDAGVQILAGLLGFGIAQTMVRYIPHHLAKKEYQSVKLLIRKGLGTLLLAGIAGYGVIVIVIVTCTPLFKKWWPHLASSSGLILVMGIMLPLGLVLFFCTQSLRGFLDIRYMVIGSSFIQLIVKIGITVLLFSLGLSLLGYVWAVVISTAIALTWMALGLYRHLQRMNSSDSQYHISTGVKEWRSYARVMYGNSLLGVGSAHLDRFLLGYVLNTGAVGILLVAKTLQQMPNIFLQMFLTVVAPMFSAANARRDKEVRQHLYHVTTDWLVRISLPLLIFLGLFAVPVLALFGNEFAQKGHLALRILLIGQMINLICGPIGNVLNMSGLEKPMFKISVLQNILVIISYIIVIPLAGLEGAASVAAFGMIFVNLSAIWIARQQLGHRWWEKRYSRWFLPTSICIFSGLIFHALMPSVGAVGLIVVLASLYFIFHGIYLAWGMNSDDREVWMAIRKKLRLASS